MLQTVFWACFGIGAGFVIISFILGEVMGFFGGGTEVDLDIDCDINGLPSGSSSCNGTGSGVSPFKPVIIALFLAIFGGSGLLLDMVLHLWPVVVALAALAGMTAAFVVFRFVMVPLYRSQNTSAQSIQSFIGSKATVILTIPQGKFGEITYSANGNTYTAPAKSEDETSIAKGADVEIVSIEEGVYYVRVIS